MKGRAPQRVDVECAAKVNLGWWVGHKREDGFHEVRGNVQTISLSDGLEITSGDEGSTAGCVVDIGGAALRLHVPGHEDLEDEGNIVVRAARVLSERIPPRPVTISIRKAIPVAAGLGGGSADAAGALVGLNAAWGGSSSARVLVKLAAEVGSDVPAILLGGLVNVSGRGEVVRAAGSFGAGFFVLGVGAEHVSAADAYAAMDGRPRTPASSFHHNDLEAAACSLVPGLEGRLQAMRAETGIAFVSGSGPTVVGVAADEAHARGVGARVREHFADVLVARPNPWGVRLTLGGPT